MMPAIVIVLPVPVAPSRVTIRSPPDSAAAASSIARGWSAAGVKIGSRRNSGTTFECSGAGGRNLCSRQVPVQSGARSGRWGPASRCRGGRYGHRDTPGALRPQADGTPRPRDGRGRRAQARRRRPRPHGARHRRHHRHRHLRHHRRGDRGRRPLDRPVLRAGRHHLPVLGALLRRARVVDPGFGQRLHVRVRDARRAGRLDHRLGPDPRVRRVGRRGGGGLGRLPAEPARLAVRHQPARLDLRPAGRRGQLQPAGDVPRPGRDGGADLRHPRKRAGQHDHGRRQDPDPRVLHPRGLRLDQRRQLLAVGPERCERHGRRGRSHLLRLHRVRRGVDVGRGGDERPTRPADRDHRLAAHRDAALHPRRDRCGRTGALEGPRGLRRAAQRRDQDRRRARLGRRPAVLRRARGDHERHAHDPLRPDADLLRHEPRRAAAEGLLPAHRAAHAGGHDAHVRHPDGDHGRAAAAERDRQARQHRHAVRVPASSTSA